MLGTRWADNDIYGHVNNVQYYALFDTLINAWLIGEGGLDIQRGSVIGLCAESRCQFHAALAFPDEILGALRVAKLGRTSVTYELALAAGPDTSRRRPGRSCTSSSTVRHAGRHRSTAAARVLERLS